MANKVIVTRSKLDSLAESISNKSGAELPLTIAEMIYEVDNLVLNTQIIQVGSGAYLDENNNIVFVNGDGESATLGTKTITANGTYNASSDSLDGYSSVTVNVSSQAQPTQTKIVTPTESQQTILPDSGYLLSSVTVNAISSTYVGSGITQRSYTDLTVSGATVTVPAGCYSAAASKSVSSMTLPTSTVDSASGSTVATINRNTRDKCLNIPVGYNAEEATYIIAATPNMTLPTSASSSWVGTEKATIWPQSGVRYLNIPVGYNDTAQYYYIGGIELLPLTVTENGTYNAADPYDVHGFSSVTVNVPPQEVNLQAKTNIAPTTSSQTITADSGYDGLSSVQINAMPTMTLPNSTTTTHTGTFKVTIPQSTTQRYLNIPVGYNSTAQYYQLNAMELTTLTITENGTYNAASPYDVDGFSSVTVAIPFSTITTSSSNPSGGSDGDIWIKVS